MQDIIDFEEISDENEYMQIEWLEDYDDTEIEYVYKIEYVYCKTKLFINFHSSKFYLFIF